MTYNPLDFLEGTTLYNYHFTDDSIEFWTPGSIVTMTDEEEMKYVKSLIQKAKRFSSTKDEVCRYLQYIGNDCE